MTFQIHANVKDDIVEIRKTFQQINRIFDSLLGATYLKLDASNSPLTGTLTAQSIVPTTDNTYDLGSGAKDWREVFAVDGNFSGELAINGGSGVTNGVSVDIEKTDGTNATTEGLHIEVTSSHTSGIGVVRGHDTIIHGNTNGSILPGIFGGRYTVSAESADNIPVDLFLGHQVQMKSTAGQSGTLAESDAYRVLAPSWAGSVPTTIRGVNILNQGNAGATDSFGIRIADQTGSTNPWSIYSEGGKMTHMGDVGIGAEPAPLTALHITRTTTDANQLGLSMNLINQDTSGGLSLQYGILNVMSMETSGCLPAAFGYNTSIQLASPDNFSTQLLAGGLMNLTSTAAQVGTIADAAVLRMTSPSWGGNAPTTFAGLEVQNQGNAKSTTSYAIWLKGQTGSTNSYAFVSEGGMSVHAGDLRLGDTSDPTETLDVEGTMRVDGHSAIGNIASVSANNLIDIVNSEVASSSSIGVNANPSYVVNSSFGFLRGIDCFPRADVRAGGAVTDFLGIRVAPFISATGGGIVTNIIGSFNQLHTQTNATTTLTNAYAVQAVAPSFLGSKPTNNTGVDIGNQGLSGITLSKGLQIDDQTGSTTNWAIAADGGDSYHVGDLRIGSSVAPTVALTVTGEGYFSSHLEIDGTLNHDGALVGFYGVAPAAQDSAWTQTYSTPNKTVAAMTAPGAGAGSGADGTTFSGAECDALRADVLQSKENINGIIDALQAIGISL